MEGRKRACVLTNGCPENRIDSARLLELLRRAGWMITNRHREADLIIFNACGHTVGSEELSLQIIKRIGAEKDSSARLIVCGCLPKIHPECLGKVCRGEVLGLDEIERLGEVFGTELDLEDVQAHHLISCIQSQSVQRWYPTRLSNLLSPRTVVHQLAGWYMARFNGIINVFRPHTFCIKVSSGCLGTCSYCAIRFSRGRVRSKGIDEVKAEFEQGLREGYREFALIGTDLGAYGRDRRTDLTALLRELIGDGVDCSIRLRNVHPKFLHAMMPQLMDIFESGRIAYLGTAAESGSNRVLAAMNRGYTVEQYKDIIRILNRRFPNVEIRTQLMVGFPGETEADFRATLDLLDQVRIDYVEIYEFEARPNTRAEQMDGQIPRQLIKKRALRLLIKSIFNNRERRRKAVRRYRLFQKGT